MAENKTYDELAAEVTVAWITCLSNSPFPKRPQFLDEVKKFYNEVFKQITESHDAYYNR
jgi:hypothetical protein